MKKSKELRHELKKEHKKEKELEKQKRKEEHEIEKDQAVQKKIALINDLSGFGRCSLTVSLPIISALKVECAVLPTCILSNHTAYPSYFIHDCTEYMNSWMDEWKKLDLHFDGIYTGFLGSARQIDEVIRFLDLFRKEDTLLIVDPVMGDHGKIYPTYTDEMCDRMKELAVRADILTPNLTEACRLLDKEYSDHFTMDELEQIGKDLLALGVRKAVITGIQKDGDVLDLVFEQDQPMTVHAKKEISPSRHGTGDVFASIVAAKAVRHEDFVQSVKDASAFVRRCLKVSKKLHVPSEEGVAFEELLTELR